MPKIETLTSSPRPPKAHARAASSRVRRRTRLRADQTAGRSRYGNPRVMGSSRAPEGARSEGVVDLLEPRASGELQEHGCQLVVVAAGQRRELVHRAARDDARGLDDADAVAHLLCHLER